MKKRGTLNTSRKIEQVVGLFTALYVNANSKENVSVSDYMPFEIPKKPLKRKTQAEKIKALFEKIGTVDE